MTHRRLLVLVLGAFSGAAILAVSPGANAQRTSPSQLGSSFEIRYGIVKAVEVSKLDVADKTVAKGATVGGIIGLTAASHDHDLRGALEGAVAGSLVARAIAKHQNEDAPNAYTYTVALVEGGESKIITETGDIRQGDCVSIEQGQTANVRRVGEVYCDATHYKVAMGEPMVHDHAQASAAECAASKQEVLKAKNEADVDLAMKKVRIFCES